jgi:protein-S-isoprenylcysteine O-methyltransferase Ste14
MIAAEVAAFAIICVLLVVMTNPWQNRPDRSRVHSMTGTTRVMMAVVQFLAVICVGLAIPANMYGIGLIRVAGWFNVMGLVLMTCGLLIRIYSMRALGRYYSTLLFVNKDQVLITEGIYGIVRHPIYLGDLVLFVAAGVAVSNSLVLLAVSASSIPAYFVRMRQEERMMVESYGSAYVEYKKRTKKLIPLVY